MSDFSGAERSAVYRAIYARRDIRTYRPDPVPDEVLWRILEAAHHAASVGFMQPWNFLLLRDPARRQQIHDHFKSVSAEASEQYDGDRQQTYLALKLQGILDAPLNVLITCDTTRGGSNVLGRSTIPETDVYSTCLAVQNFWLAARAEGVGVGWMSIMEPPVIRALLGMPDHIVPVAYLTVGYPIAFPQTPMLERVGWRKRESLAPLVFSETWGQTGPSTPPLPAPVPAPDLSPPAEAIVRNADLTRPPGSLGQLEDVALKLCGIQGRVHPRCQDRHLLLLAGDHGVCAERVSAYRSEVTARMVYQFIAGASAVSAIAREVGLAVSVADLGVDHDFGAATGLAHHKVRRGTRNLRREAAMTAAECAQAIAAGRTLLEALPAVDLVAIGEMGIGNSTAAAALTAALLDRNAVEVVGPGTGVGHQTRQRKIAAVDDALSLHRAHLSDPDEVLRRLGGYELAGLVGVIEAAADRGVAVVLDGFITCAAALVALRRTPSVQPYLIASHCSSEPGAAPLLEALGVEPLLDLGLHLGEGSGAALAVGLISAACRTMNEMVTFAEAGIEHPLDPDGRA
ncbi:MAG: nicotinate-nucleotide--dimethylbenzimidazole phosphoribosyltransferase [Myxococcota bacterium]|nr:nicotinate-nucleotide--dimethylbenzimidazole phosphoribosyltransferase [Myxococcota bacterium]